MKVAVEHDVACGLRRRRLRQPLPPAAALSPSGVACRTAAGGTSATQRALCFSAALPSALRPDPGSCHGRA